MEMLINGKKVNASDGGVIKVFNPATQEYLDSVPLATNNDINVCLDFAQEGKKIWSSTHLHKRTEILEKYSAKIMEHIDELAILQCKEMGKPINQCRGELIETADFFRSFAEHAKHLYDIVMPDSIPGLEKDISFTRREPLGVVLCIIPFNYPPALYAYKVAPAIAMGNSVIVKPSSSNPLVIIKLVELFVEAGIPGSVMQVITGSGSTISEKLVPSNKIDAISFTGSTKTGIEITRKSADALHRVFLELGGNDPLIVFDDANLEYAVNEAYSARIVNAGQVCSADKRFIIQNSIKEEFIQKLIQKLRETVVGDPIDPKNQMGCLISESAAKEVERMVNLTIQQGAKCLYGGKRFKQTYFQPTLIDKVKPNMDIARDMEVFGPVFPVIGFNTEEEAITIANNSIYGLNGGVITSDIGKGIRVAGQIQCGTLVVNGAGNYRHKDHAFGGYKKSGIGREGISVSLEEMSQVKTYVLKGILNKPDS